MQTIIYTCDTCGKNVPYHPVDGPTPNKYRLEFFQHKLNKKEYPTCVEMEVCRDCEDNIRNLMCDNKGKRTYAPMLAALKNFLVSIAIEKT